MAININNAAASTLEALRLDHLLQEVTYRVGNDTSWISTLQGNHAMNGVRFHTHIEPDGRYTVGVLVPYPYESRHFAALFCIHLRNRLNRY